MLAHGDAGLLIVIATAAVLTIGAMVGGLVYAVHVWRWEGRRQRERQLRETRRCIHCGYDLRYSKDRCPECGEVIEIG